MIPLRATPKLLRKVQLIKFTARREMICLSVCSFPYCRFNNPLYSYRSYKCLYFLDYRNSSGTLEARRSGSPRVSLTKEHRNILENFIQEQEVY